MAMPLATHAALLKRLMPSWQVGCITWPATLCTAAACPFQPFASTRPLLQRTEPSTAAFTIYSCPVCLLCSQVLFDGECLCDGPVETWLNSVVASMKQALFAEYTRAVPAYLEMKRATEWIYEFSAQNTVVVSRTFFTQEVNEAFEELEEGNEDALKVPASRSRSWLSCAPRRED